MIEQILPQQVASFASFTDPTEVFLFPEEQACVSSAVESRRREFATGRHCARQALRRLGAPASVPLPRGSRGEVVWPAGTTGAITHCRGYRAAAVGRLAEVAAVGIDAEPNAALPQGVLEVVALPEEQVMVKELLHGRPAVRWDKLLFSAKESVYKTWYPLTGLPLEFDEATVDIEPLTGEFSARLHPYRTRERPGTPSVLTGRWRAQGGLVVTAVALPAGGRN